MPNDKQLTFMGVPIVWDPVESYHPGDTVKAGRYTWTVFEDGFGKTPAEKKSDLIDSMRYAWDAAKRVGPPDFILADGPLFKHLTRGMKMQTVTKTDSRPFWHGVGTIEDLLRPTKPVKLPPYKTVGVRFIYGHTLDKVYTYRVRKGAKVHLGQEVIAPTKHGKRLVVIVEIHTTKQDTGPYNYLWITQKAGAL